jgi:EpsI family protein
MKSPRLWFVAVAMLFTALVLHVRGDVDKVLPSTPLDQFPVTLGSRSATDIPIDQETLDILGKGVFLNRAYLPTPGTPITGPDGGIVSLFIAYFPTQRTGQSIHSPQHCLPGAGWTMESEGVIDLTDATGKKYTVGDYLITNGSSKQEVLYWYQMQGRTVANDYKAKLLTLETSIRYGRTDAALIRIISPVANAEDRQEARARVVTFAEQIAPLLPAYIPN